LNPLYYSNITVYNLSFFNSPSRIITENSAVKGEDGEESKKSFFAYTGLEILGDIPLCRRKSKHKHSPQGNELCGMGEQ
jgi:hypothetical protein